MDPPGGLGTQDLGRCSCFLAGALVGVAGFILGLFGWVSVIDNDHNVIVRGGVVLRVLSTFLASWLVLACVYSFFSVVVGWNLWIYWVLLGLRTC